MTPCSFIVRLSGEGWRVANGEFLQKREVAYAQTMPLDWRTGGLAFGLECYRASEFFDAHEHWEGVWLRLDEPEKSFLQALIQTAAAFHHLNAGNRRGAVSLLRRALLRFDCCDRSFGGVALEPFREEIREWLRALESDERQLPSAFPRIRLTERA